MRKIVCIVCMVLGITALLAAGGSQRSGGTAASGGGRTSEKGVFPISNKNPTLSLFIVGGLNEINTSFAYADNAYTKMLVDETGVQLTITSTTSADANERLNVMLNTGDYPEVIANRTLDIEYYSTQGIIVPLDKNELMGFPQINRIFTEKPEVLMKITASDGKIYALPSYNECLHCTYQNGRAWYYTPWIRDTGRKVPTTLDELTDFLRFVKNTDLNKNGKKDEIPMVFNRSDIQNVTARIAKAYMPFVYGSGHFGLALDSGRKIVEQYRAPEYREALRYLNGLYREGLILEDSFSLTSEQEIAIVRNAEPLAAVVASTWVNSLALTNSQRFMDYSVLHALKGPRGQQWGSNTDLYGQANPTWYATNKCKDVDLAMAVFDYINHPQKIRYRVGPKGVMWDSPDPGARGMDGRPTNYKNLVAFGTQPINSAWYNIAVFFRTQADRLSLQTPNVDEMRAYLTTKDPKYLPIILENPGPYQEFMFWVTSEEEAKYAIPDSHFIPPQLLNNEDSARVADINAILNPYKDQAIVEFITGVRDITRDADWNAYLTELDRLGSPEMVRIRQKYVK